MSPTDVYTYYRPIKPGTQADSLNYILATGNQSGAGISAYRSLPDLRIWPSQHAFTVRKGQCKIKPVNNFNYI